jgi:hypothetical protein
MTVRGMRYFFSFLLTFALVVGFMFFGDAARAQQPVASATPSPTSSIALDGRLGGTRDSFERRYGQSRASGLDRGFDVDGYGLVQVQFGGNDERGPAIVITLRSPRGDGVAATQADSGDWTLSLATRRVKRFLPADVALGKPQANNAQSASLACDSGAIAAAFGQLGGRDGDCRVSFVTPTEKTVSFATLTLTGDTGTTASSASPAEPCAGMVDWSRATGDRLSKANDVLEGIASLAASSPDAASKLTGASAAFQALTEAQRSEPAPAAAATANYYLISGFNGYGDALVAAATAVATNDRDGAAAAAAALAEAGDNIAKGLDGLEAAVADCGLSVATPAASP